MAKTTAEKVAVMQAWLDGEQIQVECVGDCWADVRSEPLWSWNMSDYRIKPKPRVIYVNEYRDGTLGRRHSSLDAAVSGTAEWTGREYVRTVRFIEDVQ